MLITLNMHGFSNQEFEDCARFEIFSKAAAKGIYLGNPTAEPPRYEECLSIFVEQDIGRDRGFRLINYPTSHHLPIYSQASANTISMPTGALKTIIKAVGQVSQPISSPPPRVVTHYIPHPPPIHHHYGRGGYGGRGGRGRGGGQPPNRRNRRSEQTEDPHINHRQAQDAGIMVPIYDTITTAPVPFFDDEAAVTVPIIDNAIAGPSNVNDLDFLNVEYVNTDLSTVGTEDIAMVTDPTAKGEYTV